MHSAFHVCRRDLDAGPIWLTSVKSLEEAKELANRLADDSPGQYFIYSAQRGIVFEKASKAEEWADVI